MPFVYKTPCFTPMADTDPVIIAPSAAEASIDGPELTKTDDAAVAMGKPKRDFRVYGTDAPRAALVTRHYTLMRTHQTVDFVKRMEDKVKKQRWLSFAARICYFQGRTPATKIQV